MDKNIMVSNALVDLQRRRHRWASLTIIKAESTGRILVVRRLKDGQVGLPCGKTDAGETPYDTAHRELFEETGVNLCELSSPLKFLGMVLFEGCYVSMYSSTISIEHKCTPAKGFEDETEPFWLDAEKVAALPSHFQSFNIMALHKAGVL